MIRAALAVEIEHARAISAGDAKATCWIVAIPCSASKFAMCWVTPLMFDVRSHSSIPTTSSTRTPCTEPFMVTSIIVYHLVERFPSYLH